ncbi:MAG: bifunctional 5,10-methylenetetrahydrofolate dehydrogenase/5,10-methenyltetrahydrofolate cyclohydrolase [Alphaproteobacteria bacterium]|nr:bifunctional 5,10-methylenetetrahydrofolate dehydrogenase/5,10-methenyltetrahydrofolate cyclohydrolase [Alphaproteobacteria bacterium]
MSAVIIDGKQMAQDIRAELAEQIKKLDYIPGLAVILVGNDEASLIYDRNKKKAAESVGINCTIYHLPEETSQEEVLEKIRTLNNDKNTHGIIVQMPLPSHLNSEEIINAVSYTKDVDGFGVYNIGLLHSNLQGAIIAATPQGVLYVLEKSLGDLSGLNAVIIGRSQIVGRPLASLLINKSCTVTVAHSKTKNLKNITSRADIVVAACGVAEMVKKDWIKPGAMVIDVGINRREGKLCGDVDFDEVKEVAGYITPVPGGVGPMTVAMLMKNTYIASLNQLKKA